MNILTSSLTPLLAMENAAGDSNNGRGFAPLPLAGENYVLVMRRGGILVSFSARIDNLY